MSFIRSGICAALLSVSATASQALPVSIDFDVEVVGYIPAYAGSTGFGTITFDDSVFFTSGDVTLSPLTGLTAFSLTLFTGEAYQQTFTAADDYFYDDFPEAYFFDGELYGIDFLVDILKTPIAAPGVDYLGALFNCGCSGDFFFGGPGEANVLLVEVNSIPVPAALPLMLGGLGLLGAAARRRG